MAALALLALFSIYLALNRIYQVDEAQNVFMSRVVAFKQEARYYSNGDLMLVGPMSWIARMSGTASAMFLWDRGLFLVVFWANLLLMAACTGLPIRGRGFPFALLAAATLAPLWDYGFEIRHENPLLLLLLLAWWMLRHASLKPPRVFLALGLLAGLTQFMAFKAFLYWVPLVAMAACLPPPRLSAYPLARRAGWVAAGLGLSFLTALLTYSVSGSWGSFLNGLRTAVGHSANPERFAPWVSLNRLPVQMPLLTCLSVGFLVWIAGALRKDWRTACTWEGPLPEAVALGVATCALLVNPTPYPYNLILVVPFAFLLAARGLPLLGSDAPSGGIAYSVVGSLLFFTHALPFATQTWRHLSFPNARQEQLMDLAEAMTGPADPVYDAAGCVPTRESIHFQWFLHSLVLPKIQAGQIPTVRSMLAANPPAVLIPSYRTDWLGKEDVAFINQHFLPLADDFLVLGGTFPRGGGSFDCLRAGRYAVLCPGHPEAAITVDGVPMPKGSPKELAVGPHHLATTVEAELAVLWIGPRLDRIPDPGPGNHHGLFVNWY